VQGREQKAKQFRLTFGALPRAVWRYQQINFVFAPNGMERPLYSSINKGSVVVPIVMCSAAENKTGFGR
jgi:hypothetical protein